MWIDSEGVAHTVALPDPTDVMTPEFRVALDKLVERSRSEVERVLEAAGERISATAGAVAGLALSDEEEFVSVAAPRDLLASVIATSTDLADSIESTNARWRLDVVLALQDYVDP